ncbi:WapI family immunity protein [Deinococcus apachensis]|uniref:WapI family immunity protein n=1 Tax=Deinococcus apachensis TaxID=309886 RepID=UPI001FE039E7|nr:hypothetical protein [Deinococcus apachensis]
MQYGDPVWEWTDPALTTFEVQWLTEWLDEVADHAAVFSLWQRNRLTTRIFFTEPCLGFEILNGHSSGRPMTLRCYLAAEFLPPFKELCPHAAISEEPDEVWLDFGVDEAQVRAIAGQWRAQLDHYPVRVGL